MSWIASWIGKENSELLAQAGTPDRILSIPTCSTDQMNLLSNMKNPCTCGHEPDLTSQVSVKQVSSVPFLMGYLYVRTRGYS
jgi:hypothetical protein